VTYGRLFVGWRFALVEMGFAQLVYLVLFSFTFFFTGFTGLSITVGAVLTLAVMMQLTGRVSWAGASRPAAPVAGPPPPAPAGYAPPPPPPPGPPLPVGLAPPYPPAPVPYPNMGTPRGLPYPPAMAPAGPSPSGAHATTPTSPRATY